MLMRMGCGIVGIGSRFEWLSDIFHVILGIAAVLFACVDMLIAVLIALCYTAYQVIDMMLGEHPLETAMDMLEFTIGVVIGALIVQACI
ncbi:MAG: hypothetical protein QW706_10065 [Candidatus Nezhaarchaeales archaeon]